MSNAIHQRIALNASPARVYGVLTDAAEFSAFTGAPATIDPVAGGAFSGFGGMISGRIVELQPNKRVVQAWRAGNWPEGSYSIVKMELAGNDCATELVLEHTAFPQDNLSHLDGGWYKMYWEPLKAYLK